jgi:DNA-binding FadR family transcriptional regulator
MRPAQKKAISTAELIQQDIIAAGWREGTVFGSEEQLCVRYQIGRGALREAIRLLEFRSFARMRRGPNGGLVVCYPPIDSVAEVFAEHLRGHGHWHEVLLETRLVLNRIAATLARSAPDPASPPKQSAGPPGLPNSEPALLSLRTLLSGNRVLDTVAQMFEVLCDRLSASQRGLNAWQLPQTRAGRIARDIIERIQVAPVTEGTRLGSEADLCARFGIGIPVARQVIRLLEASGVVDCRRGRGQGAFFRRSGAEPVAHALASYLASQEVTAAESWELGRLLTIELAVLAAKRSTGPGSQSLQRLLSEMAQNSLTGAADVVAIDRTVDQSATNDVLVTMLEGLKAYSRLRTRSRDAVLSKYAAEYGSEYLARTRAVITAILAGDSEGAAQAQQLKNDLFTRQVVRANVGLTSTV